MHDSHMMVNLHVNALSIQLYYIVDLVVTTFVLAFCNVTSNLQNSVHINSTLQIVVDTLGPPNSGGHTGTGLLEFQSKGDLPPWD